MLLFGPARLQAETEDVRINICSIRPYDCASALIHSNARELNRVVPNRFKYRPMKQGLEINDFSASIRQSERNSEARERLHRLNSERFRHGIELVESIDRLQWQSLTGQIPVYSQFRLMQSRPFQHEPNRSSLEPALKNLQCRDFNFHLIARVLGVKVRRRMIAIVHVNSNSIKITKAGH